VGGVVDDGGREERRAELLVAMLDLVEGVEVFEEGQRGAPVEGDDASVKDERRATWPGAELGVPALSGEFRNVGGGLQGELYRWAAVSADAEARADAVGRVLFGVSGVGEVERGGPGGFNDGPELLPLRVRSSGGRRREHGDTGVRGAVDATEQAGLATSAASIRVTRSARRGGLWDLGTRSGELRRSWDLGARLPMRCWVGVSTKSQTALLVALKSQ
jgi:hypothetical protein